MLDIGLEIRILRERLKMSAKDLAEKVGLSQSQMSRLEKGHRRIDTQVLNKVAAALEVDPSYFFRGESMPANEGVIAAPKPEGLGKLIRSERRKRHISAEELASRLGKPKAFLQSIEEGKRELDPEFAQGVLKALKLPASFFLGAQQQVIEGLEAQVARLNQALAESSRGDLDLGPAEGGGAVTRRGIPVLGNVVDGYPQHFDSAGRPAVEPHDYLYLPEIDAAEAFALHAVGDSMETRGSPSFREGDLLVFADTPLRSRDFAFIRTQDEATFRQVFFESVGGGVRLQPLNLGYAPATVRREAMVRTWRLVGHIARF